MADEKLHLCLLDCSGIQRYVFGSNMLRTNVGASFLVEQIYDRGIPAALEERFGEEEVKLRFEQWQKTPDEIALNSNEDLLWEIGYIGGGNALLLFRRESDVKEFIARWSRRLLKEAPGIRPACAWLPTTFSQMEHVLEHAIFHELNRNKNALFVETTLPRHGITASCRISGLSTEIFGRVADEAFPMSSVTKTKLNYFEPANEALAQEFAEVLRGEYQFSKDLENLGQSESVENHIAIVHIDGNGMGEKFKNCKTLAAKRRLSLTVERAVHNAMTKTLAALLERMPVLREEVLDFPPGEEALLPMRPMILNGDDVTFICDARLGLFLAEAYMKAFADEKIEPSLATEHFSSCAGVAIIKTKYPFYRGYTLAKELCQRAKARCRKAELSNGAENSSWLDFHISYRGLSGSLEEIRREKYMVSKASLLWRPWKITQAKEMFSFNGLKQALRFFSGIQNAESPWPRSKIHELAEALMQGEQVTQEFLAVAAARGLSLPLIAQADTASRTGWQALKVGHSTPYYDILEAMPFYPTCLLR